MDTYEKKYKEALNWMKDVYPTLEGAAKEDAEHYFPELKEAWNEKVRKWIIEMVEEVRKANPTNAEHNGMCSEAIFWLEKQGEKKPDTDFSDLRTWKDIVDTVLTEKEGIGQYLGSPFIVEVAKKLQKRFGNIQQKTAWSEADNINYKRLLYFLDGGILMQDHNIELFIWMESLKERVQSQQKQEWSEEDKKMFDSIINVLEVTPSASFIPIKRETMIPWLKSLKERYTWRPSEEQMKILRRYVMGEWRDLTMGQDKVLTSLYNDLIKLTEK